MAPPSAAASQQHTRCFDGHILPTVFLIGVAKAGTSSLNHDLVRHVRGVRAAHALPGEPRYFGKEQHYFSNDSGAYDQGLAHYVKHFESCPRRRRPSVFSIDATPLMDWPLAAARVSAAMSLSDAHGAVRIIAILRSPTERLRSAYDHFIRPLGTALDPWAHALLVRVHICAQQHHIRMDSGKLWGSPCHDMTTLHLIGGLYRPPLETWIGAFSASQLAITTFDGYLSQTSRVIQDLAHFLGHPVQHRLGRGSSGRGNQHRFLRMLTTAERHRQQLQLVAGAVSDVDHGVAAQDDGELPGVPGRGRALLTASHYNVQTNNLSALDSELRDELDTFYRPHVRALEELLHAERCKTITSTPFSPASSLTVTMLMAKSQQQRHFTPHRRA